MSSPLRINESMEARTGMILLRIKAFTESADGQLFQLIGLTGINLFTVFLEVFTPNSTRHNSADSVPTSNLVCIKKVAIRTTFYCWNNLLHLQLSY